eukprot:Phypoly_transcript_14764.p1 GENE.Phypoly_transcript_14764~~Phypoly_transcript_14764.p1  ORF type:complete len:168 (-),score=7.32 Phypoly_transcript_14764:430-933(-)
MHHTRQLFVAFNPHVNHAMTSVHYLSTVTTKRKAILVPRERVTLSFSQSSGPGGQNVNKVNTKVELRFSLVNCDWIPFTVKERLIELNPNMVTSAGDFVLTSTRHRTQPENIKDVLAKLESLLAQAQEVPKVRIPTKPPKSADENRLQDKKYRSDIKRGRSMRGDGD